MQCEKIKFYTMSVLRPEDNSAPVEDIVFLYRYLNTDLFSYIFLQFRSTWSLIKEC